jgi:hypothetical protein
MGYTQGSYRNYRERMTRIIISGLASSYCACNTLKYLAMMHIERTKCIIDMLEERRDVPIVPPGK